MTGDPRAFVVMTLEQIIGLTLALLVMGIGVVGALVPGIPSLPLLLLAVVGHKLWFGEASTHGWVLALLIAMTLLAVILDYVVMVIGARKLGATRWGTAGALLGVCFGMVMGVFFGGLGSLVGVVVGPFLGATLLEFTGGKRSWRKSSRAGLGATLGLLAGTVGKVGCGVLVIVIFTVDVVVRSL